MKLLPLVLTAFGTVSSSFAQFPVRDINTTGGPPEDQIGEMINAAGGVFFTGSSSDVAGRELWFTNGTASGTRLVRDIVQGPASSDPRGLTEVGIQLFFTASMGRRHLGRASERGLYVSDGTAAGTRLLRAFETGIDPRSLRALDANRAVFFAGEQSTGRELWISDGTPLGTHIVRDIRPGAASSLQSTSEMIVYQNAVYFGADDGVFGEELWTSDGTSAGTRRLTDLVAGAGNPGVRVGAWTLGDVWFTATTPAEGRELWRWDGSSARIVGGIRFGSVGSAVRDLKSNGFTVYFSADDGRSGRQLWRAGLGGTVRVTSIGTAPLGCDPRHITLVGLTPLFSAFTASQGRELWQADVGTSGPALVADLEAGIGSSSPHGMTSLGFFVPVVFGANVGGSLGLYATDTITTNRIHERGIVHPDRIARLTPTQVVYAAEIDGRNELWRSDGTAAGTVLVKTLNDANGSSSPSRKIYHAGIDRFFFVADDGLSGKELWTSDGTSTGTRIVRDIFPGPASGDPRELIEFGDHLLFFADDATGTALWQSDGTAAGTRVAVLSGPGVSLTTIGSASLGTQRLLVQTSSPNALFAWDGARLVMLANLYWGLHPTSAGDIAYFVQTSRSSINDSEIWKTDGTRSGTVLVTTVTSPGGVDWTRAVGGRLYLALHDPLYGKELWTSLGTASTTRLVRDIAPGVADARPDGAIAHGGELYFAATDPTNGRELWRTDGTAANTLRVANIASGPSSSNPHDLVSVGDAVFFSAWTNGGGRELWLTDSTAGTTRVVKDMDPGPWGSNPTELARADSGRYVVFAAGRGPTGYEVWTSNGTSHRTAERVRLRYQTLGCDPRGFTLAGTRVFYDAFDDGTGRELYQLPVAAFGGAAAEPFGRGGPGSRGRPFVAAEGLPRFGNPAFGVLLHNAPPNTVVALWIAATTTPFPLGPGCTLLVPAPLLVIPGLTDANGDARTVLPFLRGQPLGTELVAQYGVIDPQGCLGGVANLSDAMRIVLGR